MWNSDNCWCSCYLIEFLFSSTAFLCLFRMVKSFVAYCSSHIPCSKVSSSHDNDFSWRMVTLAFDLSLYLSVCAPIQLWYLPLCFMHAFFNFLLRNAWHEDSGKDSASPQEMLYAACEDSDQSNCIGPKKLQLLCLLTHHVNPFASLRACYICHNWI